MIANFSSVPTDPFATRFSMNHHENEITSYISLFAGDPLILIADDKSSLSVRGRMVRGVPD